MATSNCIAPRQGRGKITEMSSTHLSLHIHVIFGTKHQRPLIQSAWRPRFHAYLGGAAKTLEVVPEAVGGVADHVHLLLGIRATHQLADVIRDLKRTSSAWVHESIGEKDFQWQDGYGAFTVSASMIETVKNYIARQEEHHAKKNFQEEYVEFLKLHGVEYDPRYLW
jgi:putative transposase